MLALYAQSAAAAYVGDGQTGFVLHAPGRRYRSGRGPRPYRPQVHFGLTVALCEASELDATLRHGHRGQELARQAADENDQADFLRLLSEIRLGAQRAP
jgi:hypothetical protein